MRKLLTVSALLLATTSAANAGVEIRSTGITVGQFNSNCAAMEGSADDAVGGRRCTLPSGTQVTCAFGNSSTTDCLVETTERRKGGKNEQQEYLHIEIKDLLVSSYREGDSEEHSAPGGSLTGSDSVDPGPTGGSKFDSVGGAGAGPSSMMGGAPTGSGVD